MRSSFILQWHNTSIWRDLNTRFQQSVIFLFAIFLFSHQALSKIPDLNFKHITIEDGLSSSEIENIIQDRQGFIWFATSDGLNRFDGYNIKIYRSDPDNSTSLINNTVRSLYIDHQGSMWIGTLKGVSRYVKETDSFVNYLLNSTNLNSNLVNQVNTILENSQNTLYATAEDGNIYQLDQEANTFKQINTYDFGVIKAVEMDAKDNFWVGSMTKGLFYYNPRSDMVTPVLSAENDTQQHMTISVNALLLNDEELWVGTSKKGIARYSIPSGEFKTYFEKEPSHSFVSCAFRDHSGNIWVGDSHGLLLYDRLQDRFIIYQHKNEDATTLATVGVRSIFEDFQGNFWVSSAMGGINLSVVKKAFTQYSLQSNSSISLTKKIISSILIDNQGKAWFGSFNTGIDVIDLKNKTKRYILPSDHRPGALSPGTIYAIYEDQNNTIWIGTYLGGLQRYDARSNSFISYRHDDSNPNSIAGNDVRGILQDKNGEYWIIVHSKGLDRYNPKTKVWKNYRLDPDHPNQTLADDWTMSVLQDHQGYIWVATPNGLSRLDPVTETFKNFHYDPNDSLSISNSFIISLHEDADHRLWIGTMEGLNRYNPSNGTFTRFTQKDGLPNNVINCILHDDIGHLWIGTNYGLSRFSIEEKVFRNYDIHDGLSSNEFLPRSCYRSESGALYFGTNNGVISFYPNQIKDNEFIPPVYLSDLKLFNQSIPVEPQNPDAILKKDVSETEKIHLSYKENILTFEYVALNFINSEKNQYAYMLEGFDNTWQYVGTKRQVTYTNLDPDQYIFKVKASNNDNIWNEAGAELQIIIYPPFWATWWFRLLGVLLCLTVVLTLVNWRTRVLRNRNEQLASLVQDQKDKLVDANKQLLVKERMAALGQLTATVAHEIRNPLGTVRSSIFSIEDAYQKDNKDRVKRALSLAERNIVRCDNIITELLDFTRHRDPRIEKVEMAEWLRALVQEQSIPSTIGVELRLDDTMALEIDKGELYRAVVNVVDNAIQAMEQREGFQQVNRLTVQTQIVDNRFEIIVEDTGPGISEKDKARITEPLYSTKTYGVGLGLAIVQKVMDQHQGGLEFTSIEKEGSRFTLWLPIA